jgi:clan AA aspartic protease (TIGR02281 family)
MDRNGSGFDQPFSFRWLRFLKSFILMLVIAAAVYLFCISLVEAKEPVLRQVLITPYAQLKSVDFTPQKIAQMELYNGRIEDPYRGSMILSPSGLPAARPQIKSQLSRVEVELLPQVDKTLAVMAVVNRKHMATFVIDTGASYTVITPRTARAWGLQPSRPGQTLTVTTANGTVEAPLVMLKNVNLGGMDMMNVQAVVIDLGDNIAASGLLGMNFFEGMEFIVRPDKLILSKIGS